MKKDILAKAVRLADKSKDRPDKVGIGKPAAANKKPVVQVLSERLYTRISPAEMKRLNARIGEMISVSTLLRSLLTDYLDNQDKLHGRSGRRRDCSRRPPTPPCVGFPTRRFLLVSALRSSMPVAL